jgi:aspartyl protease family protein
MRALLPLAVFAAALAALLLTPADKSILGLSHGDFGRGAMGVSLLSFLLMSGIARAGAGGAARVFGGVAAWGAIGLALVAVYAYRDEFAEVARRFGEELDPNLVHVGPGGEVVVRRRGGEFVLPGKVNGHTVSFVFDTGASAVVLTAEDAAASGVHFGESDYQAQVTTANGSALAAPVRLDSVAIGPIVERSVRALVARPGVLKESLLGMTFLERLKGFAVEGGKLVLKGG